LKRVAGVTVNDGKFVTIRGMSERYNNVQLNGSSLASTEPNRRNFSFDIVPSNLIENVTINKTFTPDLP
jgi:outer membrane receptor for ferrienterochelin and colicin